MVDIRVEESKFFDKTKTAFKAEAPPSFAPPEAGFAPPKEEEIKIEVTPEQAQLFVETVVRILGQIQVGFAESHLKSKCPELDYSPTETRALVASWSPFVPTMSPITAAFITTGIIVGGKIVVYFNYRRAAEVKTKTKEEKEEF